MGIDIWPETSAIPVSAQMVPDPLSSYWGWASTGWHQSPPQCWVFVESHCLPLYCKRSALNIQLRLLQWMGIAISEPGWQIRSRPIHWNKSLIAQLCKVTCSLALSSISNKLPLWARLLILQTFPIQNPIYMSSNCSCLYHLLLRLIPYIRHVLCEECTCQVSFKSFPLSLNLCPLVSKYHGGKTVTIHLMIF